MDNDPFSHIQANIGNIIEKYNTLLFDFHIFFMNKKSQCMCNDMYVLHVSIGLAFAIDSIL